MNVDIQKRNRRRGIFKSIVRLSVCLSICVSVAYFAFVTYPKLPDGRALIITSSFASHSVTIMSILVAAGAILMTIANTRLMRNMAKTGHYQRLVDSLLGSAVLFLLTAVLSILMLYMPAYDEQYWFTLTSVFFVTGLYGFIATGWMLYSVLVTIYGPIKTSNPR